MASGVLRNKGWALNSIGNSLAWLIFLAGLLDVVENVALVVMLFDAPTNLWPQVACPKGCLRHGVQPQNSLL